MIIAKSQGSWIICDQILIEVDEKSFVFSIWQREVILYLNIASISREFYDLSYHLDFMPRVQVKVTA